MVGCEGARGCDGRGCEARRAGDEAGEQRRAMDGGSGENEDGIVTAPESNPDPAPVAAGVTLMSLWGALLVSVALLGLCCRA